MGMRIRFTAGRNRVLRGTTIIPAGNGLGEWDFVVELHEPGEVFEDPRGEQQSGRVFVENGASGEAAAVERDDAVEGVGEVEEVGLDAAGMVGEGGGGVGDGLQVLGGHQGEGFERRELGGLEAHRLADLRDCGSGYGEPELRRDCCRFVRCHCRCC